MSNRYAGPSRQCHSARTPEPLPQFERQALPITSIWGYGWVW